MLDVDRYIEQTLQCVRFSFNFLQVASACVKGISNEMPDFVDNPLSY